MKLFFCFLILIHALIHLLGFTKPFGLMDTNPLTKDISKPLGMVWLLTAILFLLVFIGFLLRKEWWPILAFIAIVISQTLIFLYWKDAKFGTITNTIILIVSISAYSSYRFNQMVIDETNKLIANITTENTSIVTEEDVKHLPEIVKKWMQNSGVIGNEKINSASLSQKGFMKTKPDSQWKSFSAKQYFDVSNPSFIWFTEVDFMPMVNMVGRDKFVNGKGEMLIKLASIVPVVNEADNEKINSGTMIRYMAEIIWFPSAALNDYIKWETIDERTAKATFTADNKSVSGIFKFSEEGRMISFEAQRYYGAGKKANQETWLVKVDAYKTFNDYTIPSRCKIVWRLKDADFEWLALEVFDVKYNIKD